MKTFENIYLMPFVSELPDTWIRDQNHNFAFQFESFRDEKNELFLDVINGKKNLKNSDLKFYHKDGEIRTLIENIHIITIRGWGNLTSPNCLGLSQEEAANVQDTLAEYIAERLNDRSVK